MRKLVYIYMSYMSSSLTSVVRVGSAWTRIGFVVKVFQEIMRKF